MEKLTLSQKRNIADKIKQFLDARNLKNTTVNMISMLEEMGGLNVPASETDNFGYKQQLKDILPQSHFIDLRVRLNGEYYWFECDWLKDVIRKIQFIPGEYQKMPNLDDSKQKTEKALIESELVFLEKQRVMHLPIK